MLGHYARDCSKEIGTGMPRSAPLNMLSAQELSQEHYTLIASLQNQVSLQQQLLLAKAELARQDKCLMNALAPLGGRAGELFGAACGGYLHSLMKRVLSCVRVAVEMPFSSTLAAAAGATERLRGCTVARKISLLALSIFAHRGVGRR